MRPFGEELEAIPGEQPLLNTWERLSPARRSAVRRKRVVIVCVSLLAIVGVIVGAVLGVQARQREPPRCSYSTQ